MSIESVFNRGFLTLLTLLITSLLAGGQIVQVEHTEIPFEENDEKFKVISLADNGLMMYRRTSGQGDDKLEMIKLDTLLKVDWNAYVDVPRFLKLVHVEYTNSLFCLFFKHQYQIGGDFQLVTVRAGNAKTSIYTIKNLIPFNSTEFVITPYAVLIGGYFNYRPMVLHYSFKDGISKILPGFFNEIGEINEIKSYPDGSFDVIVCGRNLEKKKSLWLRNYDAGGDLIKTVVLDPQPNKQLLFGRSIKLSNGDQIVAGVYGKYSEYSRGIFIAELNSAGEYAMRFYNFGDLHNFFSYMKLQKQLRVKTRIERRNDKGKKIKFNYRFLIHDIIPYGDQYIMTGEAFYPHYTSSNAATYYRNRSGITNSYYPMAYSNLAPVRGDLVFDGYQYTHAVVVGFDKSGKIQWDNSFEINDVRTPQLQQFVKVKPEKDRIVMMYLYQNSLRSKIIRNSEVIEGKTYDKPKKKRTKYDDASQNEALDFWYGDYFFSYGIQKKTNDSYDTRKVFYINKVVYR